MIDFHQVRMRDREYFSNVEVFPSEQCATLFSTLYMYRAGVVASDLISAISKTSLINITMLLGE